MPRLQKSILFILLSISSSGSYAYIGQPQNSKTGNYVCIIPPKCGTHMLLQFLTYLSVPGVSYNFKQPIERNDSVASLNKHMPPHHYKGVYDVATQGPLPKKLLEAMEKYSCRLYWTHWIYTPEFAEFLQNNTAAVYFMIRDPRDQLISMARMVQQGYEEGQIKPLEDIIFDLIDGRQQNFLLWGVERNGVYPLEWESGVMRFYQLYLPWMELDNVCCVKFEDLVGPQGGGDQELQLATMQNIAQRLGKNLTREEAGALSAKLFGGSATFKDGKIGAWKTYFNDDMKKAFKKAYGTELLVRLGYENDDNW